MRIMQCLLRNIGQLKLEGPFFSFLSLSLSLSLSLFPLANLKKSKVRYYWTSPSGTRNTEVKEDLSSRTVPVIRAL